MNPGRLNKRIEVWHFTETRNELFEIVKREELLLKLWASVTDIRGIKKQNDVVHDVQYSYKILIRYNSKVDESMVVKYQGRSFKINSVVDVNFSHKEMILLCEEVN